MIGIVIVTYNSENYIDACLASLFSELDDKSKVILVDNASRDESVKIVEDNWSRVEVVKNDSNKGFSVAVNQGIKLCLQADCEYILLLNPDTVLEKGALGEMLRVMQEGAKTAVVQPLITLMSDPEKINTWGNEYKGFGLVSLGGFGQELRTSNFEHRTSPISYASGACMLIRASILAEIGLFDERYFLYFEDTEFSERVRQAGYELKLASKARVQHDYHRPYALKKFVYFCTAWMQYLRRDRGSIHH